MTITELALLRLSPDMSIKSQPLLANLAVAKKAMEDFTSLPFYYYHCVEDPSLLYLLGGWSSLSQHLESWIPSPANQALLQLLKDQLEVEWMFHVDIDPSTLPLGSPTLAIARHFLAGDSRARSEEIFKSAKHHVERSVGGEEFMRGGWRIGEEEQGIGEEWVLFADRQHMEKYLKFARAEGFTKEVRHAVQLEVE